MNVGKLYGIMGVAVRAQDGTIFTLPPPYRHHHLLKIVHDLTGDAITPTQGFWTVWDNRLKFLTRQDTLVVLRREGWGGELIGGPLTSEDLW